MSSEVAVIRQESVGESVFAGALAGMIGGLLFIVFGMIAALIGGLDGSSPVRLIGATFVGAGALESRTAIVLYGLLLHTLTAMGWGVLFALVLPREIPTGAAFVGGLIHGLIVMLVMLYLVLPFVNPVMHQAVDGTTAFTLQHLAFGAALGLVPALRRRLSVRQDQNQPLFG